MKYFRKYRNAFCILLTGLLLVWPALYLQAQMLYLTAPGGVSSDTPTDTVSDGDSVKEYSVITGYENMEVLNNLPELRLVQRTSPHNTNDLLEHVFSYYRINAYVQRPDGTTETITLRVNWDCFGYDVFRVDVTTPGSYTEIGRIQLPDEQTVFGEDVPSELTVPVTVYVPDTPVEITYIQELSEDFIFYSSYALEQYHDVSEVTDLLRDTWVCEDANGHEYECSVVLDTSLVDTDTLGLYEITGTFLPPLHCTFSEELEIPSFTLVLSVQAPGQPRLDCMQLSMWYLYFPWIARDMDLDSMKVWLSENDGEWRELCQYDEVYLTESDLSLDPYFLTEGSSYRLQVDYEGGQTGIASFEYDEGVFQFKEYIEGDRDGGDTNGNLPGVFPTSIPTSIPPTSPTVAPTATPTIVPELTPTPAPTATPTIAPGLATTPAPTATPTIAPGLATTPAPTATPTIAPGLAATPAPTIAPGLAATPAPTATPTIAPGLATTPAPTATPTIAPGLTTTPAPTATPTIAPEMIPTVPPAIESPHPPIVTPSPKPNALATPTPPSLRSEPYLLGSEIIQMVETTGFARFSNQEIMLSLPAATIKELSLKESDQFLVILQPYGTYGFSLDISRNKEPLTELANMQVTLPYTPKNTSVSTLVLIDNIGNEVSQGYLSEAQGLVTFTLQQTGVFSIQEGTLSSESEADILADSHGTSGEDLSSATTAAQEQVSPTATEASHFPWLIMTISLLLFTLTIILLIIYTKRGKNNA